MHISLIFFLDFSLSLFVPMEALLASPEALLDGLQDTIVLCVVAIAVPVAAFIAVRIGDSSWRMRRVQWARAALGGAKARPAPHHGHHRPHAPPRDVGEAAQHTQRSQQGSALPVRAAAKLQPVASQGTAVAAVPAVVAASPQPVKVKEEAVVSNTSAARATAAPPAEPKGTTPPRQQPQQQARPLPDDVDALLDRAFDEVDADDDILSSALVEATLGATAAAPPTAAAARAAQPAAASSTCAAAAAKGATPAPSPPPAPVPRGMPVRHAWFQTATALGFTFDVRARTAGQVRAECASDRGLEVRIAMDGGREFVHDVDDLFGAVDPKSVAVAVRDAEVQVSVRKRAAGQWPSLERSTGGAYATPSRPVPAGFTEGRATPTTTATAAKSTAPVVRPAAAASTSPVAPPKAATFGATSAKPPAPSAPKVAAAPAARYSDPDALLDAAFDEVDDADALLRDALLDVAAGRSSS